jgi:hypothetical protein
MPVLDRAALIRRPAVVKALSDVDGAQGAARGRATQALQRALAKETGAPVDASEVRALVVQWQASRQDVVEQKLGPTLGAGEERQDWGRSTRNPRGALALRTGEHADAGAGAKKTRGPRRVRARAVDWMQRHGAGKKGVATALASIAAATALVVPTGGGAAQSLDGARLAGTASASRVVDAPPTQSPAATKSPEQIAQELAAQARAQRAHDVVDRATRNLLGRPVRADDPLLARAEKMLARGDAQADVVHAVRAAIKKSDEFRATRAAAHVTKVHRAIFGRSGPTKGPVVEKARALLLHGKTDAQVDAAIQKALLDVPVPKSKEAPFGRVDLSTQRGRDVFRAAAHLAHLPRAWADSAGLRALVEHESGGRVARPNYTYGARSEDPAKWASVVRELRAGRITTESTATGLGQLLSYNVERFYPHGVKGIGDPVEEAVGMLKYIAASYGNPDVAWGNHSANPRRHVGVPVIYTAEGY